MNFQQQVTIPGDVSSDPPMPERTYTTTHRRHEPVEVGGVVYQQTACGILYSTEAPSLAPVMMGTNEPASCERCARSKRGEYA